MSSQNRLSVSETEERLAWLNKSLKRISLFVLPLLFVGFSLAMLSLFGFSGWFGLIGVVALGTSFILLFMIDPIERKIDFLKLDLMSALQEIPEKKTDYKKRRGLAALPGTDSDRD